MIIIKTTEQFEHMRKAGAIVRDVLNIMQDSVRPGITTADLDKIAYKYITDCKAKPSFKGYNGFPATICASIDDEVVHGIPSAQRKLEEGQIISIDVGAYIHGYHGDAARTIAVGAISEEKQRLIDVTRECFFKGIEQIVPDARLGDVSNAIQVHAESHGYSVVRALVGHGIGSDMHEDPAIPNYGKANSGVRLSEGMGLAIEPMINMGKLDVYFCEDGWTVKTKDGLPSAHYENTVIIGQNGPEILTL